MLGSITTALSGATNDPEPSVLISKRLGSNGASDRWKLYSKVEESNLTLLDAAFAFDPNLIYPQNIFVVLT